MPNTRAQYAALEHVAVGIEAAFGNEVAAAASRIGAAHRIRVTVPDFAAALFVVATSSLLATVPRPLALSAARVMPLTVAEPPFPIAGSPIAMIWPRRMEADPAHAWLRSAVLETAGKPPSRRSRLSGRP